MPYNSVRGPTTSSSRLSGPVTCFRGTAQKKATTKVQYLIKQLLKGDPSKVTRYADFIGTRAVERRTKR